MIDKLKKSNPTLQIYSVTDAEFNEYGRVLNIDSDEIVKVGEEIPLPESGVSYSASLKEFESCEIAELIRDNCFGQLPVQIGYCRGHNSMMNAMEWHTCSEINIAVTPLILLLAHRSDIQAGMLDSKFTQQAFITVRVRFPTTASDAWLLSQREQISLLRSSLMTLCLLQKTNGLSLILIMRKS